MRFLILLSVLLITFDAAAQTAGEVTKLPLPRFVSIRADKVYARTGPGTRYPIKWVYQRRDLPVEIIQEFDTWRKIRDIDGEEGWVHQSLLSGQRFAIMNADQGRPIYRDPQEGSRAVAILQPGVILELDSCKKQWCEVRVSDFSGWIHYDFLWGVYENEEFE